MICYINRSPIPSHTGTLQVIGQNIMAMAVENTNESYSSLETFTDLGPADVLLRLDDGRELQVHSTAITMFSKVLRNVLQNTSRNEQVRCVSSVSCDDQYYPAAASLL